jgi:hypothetical protein
MLDLYDRLGRAVDRILGATLAPAETLVLRLVNRPFR